MAARATGSKRCAGITLPGNGWRVAADDPVAGSKIRIGFPAVLRRSEKSPRRLSSVGTVEVVSKLVNWRVCSQVTKKWVLSFRIGPPKVPPYWFSRTGARFAEKKLRALKTSFCSDSNRL